MLRYNYVFRNNYDKRVKLGDGHIFCYSPKKMKELYPEGNYTLLGETVKTGGEEKDADAGAVAGVLYTEAKTVDVYVADTKKAPLYKTEGFVCVGENNYIEVKTSILAFLLSASLIGVAIIACLLVILLSPKTPIVIDPDFPLPDADTNAVPLPDDTEKPVQSEEGGGAVSMTYTLEASVNLSTREIGIYLRNPGRSNHDVAVRMYLVSGGNEYLMATSGLVKAGNGLYTMTLDDNAPALREGVYTGYYKVSYFNPETGERALVEADIKGVNVTVTNE